MEVLAQARGVSRRGLSRNRTGPHFMKVLFISLLLSIGQLAIAQPGFADPKYGEPHCHIHLHAAWTMETTTGSGPISYWASVKCENIDPHMLQMNGEVEIDGPGGSGTAPYAGCTRCNYIKSGPASLYGYLPGTWAMTFDIVLRLPSGYEWPYPPPAECFVNPTTRDWMSCSFRHSWTILPSGNAVPQTNLQRTLQPAA